MEEGVWRFGLGVFSNSLVSIFLGRYHNNGFIMMYMRRRIIIAICLLTILLCVFMNNKMKEGLYETKVKAISYENQEDNDHKQNLEKMLKHYDYDYEFIGQGESWFGFGNKIKRYLCES